MSELFKVYDGDEFYGKFKNIDDAIEAAVNLSHDSEYLSFIRNSDSLVVRIYRDGFKIY